MERFTQRYSPGRSGHSTSSRCSRYTLSTHSGTGGPDEVNQRFRHALQKADAPHIGLPEIQHRSCGLVGVRDPQIVGSADVQQHLSGELGVDDLIQDLVGEGGRRTHSFTVSKPSS